MLDRLADVGVEVRALGSPGARYDFHHAKDAVADDRAHVLTENWKPAGTGGRSSRGWGVILSAADAADALAAMLRADAGWRDACRWSAAGDQTTLVRTEVANGTFLSRYDPERVPVRNVSVLIAPENAKAAVIA